MATVYDKKELMAKALNRCSHDFDKSCQQCTESVAARNELVVAMSGLFFGMAIRISDMFKKDREDVFQCGMAKVLNEFHHFSPEMGISPLTYFGRVAWRAMYDFAERDLTIQPATSWKNSPRTQKCGYTARGTMSLESITGTDADGGKTEYGSIFRSKMLDHREIGPEEQAQMSEETQLIRDALPMLPDAMREVLELKLSGLSNSEISRRKNRTRERIRQLEVKGLEKLRAIIKRLIKIRLQQGKQK